MGALLSQHSASLQCLGDAALLTERITCERRDSCLRAMVSEGLRRIWPSSLHHTTMPSTRSVTGRTSPNYDDVRGLR